MLRVGLILFLVGLSKCAQPLEEVFAWKELTFTWPSEEARENAIKSGDYIPENNLPLGLDRWKDKLFITLPRWKTGTAATLGYVPLSPANKTAAVIPYPDWKANTLPKGDEKYTDDNHIVSTFRVKVDSCDRLWLVDNGVVDIVGDTKKISDPAVLIYDLNTDKLIRRYKLKKDDIKEDSFIPNIVVDVGPGKCDQAFAYLSDVGAFGLIVYSFADNDSWRVNHHYFHFDPLKGDLNVGGVNYQWTDGVFGLALSPIQDNGYRTMYFHPLASTKEFSVSTQVIQNKTLATDPHSFNLFKIEGEKGDSTQTSASVFDEKTNVIFLAQINRDGIACWNPRKPLNPQNVALIAQDKETMQFLNDVTIDSERNLWGFSDRMPVFIYKGLDPSQVNYRIFKGKIDDLIKNTACEA